MKRKIHWPRILAEGTAIVVSILLAFAIDAWWEDRKEADIQLAQLQSLLGELIVTRDHLVIQLEDLENSLDGTLKVLALMGPDATDDASLKLRAAFQQSLNVGVFTPQQGTLRDVMASRTRIVFGSSDLWALLQSWPAIMNDLEIDGQHLESNREVKLIDALIRLDVSLLSIVQVDKSQADSRLQLPPSNFNTNLSVLLRNPGVESIFTMRAIRSQLLIGQHKSAIDIADEIISHLEDQK